MITGALKKLRDLPKEERPAFGQAMNRAALLGGRKASGTVCQRPRNPKNRPGQQQIVDVTRPGFPFAVGRRIRSKRLQAEIEQIFVSMGFQVFNLPEIETDYYNFEGLNMPRNHPARDAQDTFYFDDTMLLRTHCSSVHVHSMETLKPPIRAISTGKVYRRDPFDATHSPMFYQVDVIVIEEGLHMGDLKGCWMFS